MPPDYLTALNQWEEQLGRGQDPEQPLAWVNATHERDKQQLEQLVARLYELDFHKLFIPKAYGGERQNWLQLWMKVVLATRRTINVMPAVMYSIGPSLVFELIGSEAQKQQAFSDLCAGKQYCFGLSEPAAGTDLLAIESRAEQNQVGWRLSGMKSPLGWSAFTTQALFLVKTATAGPASLSFFKLPLDAANIKVETFTGRGMAGQHFGKIYFNRVELDAGHLIGELGRGFELTLKIQQIVKYLSTAANLGGCHNLLRQLLGFVGETRHGRSLRGITPVREILAFCGAELIRAEASALVAGSVLGLKRSQFSIASSVAKQTAISVSETIVARLRDILSVHCALDDHPLYERFHKVADDLLMVRFIDTNPAANLKNIATQLPELMRQWHRADIDKAVSQFWEIIDAMVLHSAFVEADTINLAVTNARGDSIVNAIKAMSMAADGKLTLLRKTAAGETSPMTINPSLGASAQRIHSRLEAFWHGLEQDLQPSFSDRYKAQCLAERYCHIHSCASMLLFLQANPDLITLQPALLDMLALSMESASAPGELSATVFEHLEQQLNTEQAISLVPVKLCE